MPWIKLLKPVVCVRSIEGLIGSAVRSDGEKLNTLLKAVEKFAALLCLAQKAACEIVRLFCLIVSKANKKIEGIVTIHLGKFAWREVLEINWEYAL